MECMNEEKLSYYHPPSDSDGVDKAIHKSSTHECALWIY